MDKSYIIGFLVAVAFFGFAMYIVAIDYGTTVALIIIAITIALPLILVGVLRSSN